MHRDGRSTLDPSSLALRAQRRRRRPRLAWRTPSRCMTVLESGEPAADPDRRRQPSRTIWLDLALYERDAANAAMRALKLPQAADGCAVERHTVSAELVRRHGRPDSGR